MVEQENSNRVAEVVVESEPGLPDESGIRETGAPLPHRANKLLTFAVLSYVVCFGFAVAVLWMARHDLKEMDCGRMDRSGRNQTEAARLAAVANLWLHVAMSLLIVAVTALILAREYYR